MLTAIHPKLPMRSKAITRHYYISQLGFRDAGTQDYDGYLIVEKDNVQLHFFEYKDLNPADNCGQVYIRTNDIDRLYDQIQQSGITIHPNGHLKNQPWGQREFALLDPDNNLLTFGEPVLHS